MKKLFFYALSLAMLACSNQGFAQLANPDFEEDMDNVGFPDGWSVAKGASAELVNEGASSGRRALVMKAGYAAVSQELDINDMAGKRITLSVDAKSEDGGVLGVRTGYYVMDEMKGKRWVDAPMIWNKKLNSEYQTLKASRVIPENALDGRFWFCLYRSQDEGTVTVDNIVLEILDDTTSLGVKETTILQRERDYLLDKLKVAKSRQPDNAAWENLRQEVDKLWDAAAKNASGENALKNALAKFSALNAQLLATLYPAKDFTANWKDGFERLDPAGLPENSVESWQVVALPGETAAFGVEIANTTKDTQTLTITLGGDIVNAVEQLQVRRQVLLETWYTKGATLVPDALTQLKKDGENWQLPLEPGEIVRLHISMKVKPASENAIQNGVLTFKGEKTEKTMPLALKVFANTPPKKPKLAHYQFQYSNQNVVNKFTGEAKDDLEAHGVTDIEWPFKPDTYFSEEGEMTPKSSYGALERWLAGFKDSDIRLNIFWMLNLEKRDKERLELLSPAWKRGWKELLKAYLDYAETQGVPRSRFTILPQDEIHSKHIDNAPDGNIDRYLEISKTIREAEPELPQYLTVGNYAFPADIEKVAPTLDVAIAHWPRPKNLSRNAPPEYEARKEFYEKTLPILRKNGIKTWSYHVQSGKNSNLLQYSRAYPFLNVLKGYSGFGYWAYNVSKGSTWDDTDGNILDYCLVYDGSEDNPVNVKYNVTKENIVPSIRWEAIRAGQQDGQILIYLKEKAQTAGCPDEIKSEIETLLADIRKAAGEDGYGSDAMTYPVVKEFSERMREIYAKIPQGA